MLTREKIDVVFGGPPCQGFSLIGHRTLDDSRNRLVLEFVRLVAELDATTFVFENVKGLTVGQHKRFLEELIEAFDEVGYAVRTPWKVLNAAAYGVPQSRERLILFGSKKNASIPQYPRERTSYPRTHGASLDLAPVPTCADAIGDLPDADDFPWLLEEDEVFVAKWKTPGPYAAELRCLSNDCWHFGYMRAWNSRALTSSMRTEHSGISRRRFAETPQGAVEPISRFFRLSRDGIANTLRAGTDSARGAFTSPRPIHFEFPRCVTVREMARLHGFPDWFRFHSTKWHGARQIGNAVPPPMARALAEEVMRALRIAPSAPKELLCLGDPQLLKMEMSHAAEHFGVSRPAGRRDRKSGARKRKQTDIEAERLLATGVVSNG
jgi:DNA (cytosine-5)-methyltransferase 1